ncbi:PfkB family carbohydrate kinase [Pinisolibacter aquiterrae]|uniref:PfkB family carbohydrate kinase n=1 Tax=Pinisolibacter aquiterrae TaxID=2815579 RepID=UPI001C3DFB3D|nr:PfkB family carbohydrate kinase [Pinisolibacter aquiterrae]MBV5264603.1 ribokinase [Pinisolibacter aquiterrae]MCC8233372.1 PfkB family carbohydrate kinase [Pinisolibacter aquiterrae]
MIVVFGSLNADFVFECEHAPEEGVTTRADAFRLEAGGKGANQAAAAARDGAEVAMVGAVGRDGMAERLLSALVEAGVDVGAIARVEVSTGCASIVVERSGANRIVVAGGANDAARAEMIPETLLARASHLVLQMECPTEEVVAAIARARAAGVRVVLNLAPARPLPVEALKACDVLVVNETEAAALAERLDCDGDAPALRMALGIDVIRTLGADGLEAVFGETIHRLPAREIVAVDTAAAGDCFVGVFVAARDRGADVATALERATAASALACATRGCQSSLPSRAATDAFLAR